MTLRVFLLCISIFIFGCGGGWAESNSIGALKACGEVCGVAGVTSFSTDPAVCTCKEGPIKESSPAKTNPASTWAP